MPEQFLNAANMTDGKNESYNKEDGTVFQHFGHTENFKVYEISNGEILNSEVVSNGGFGHHDLPGYLKSLGVETLLLGNRGQGAVNALTAAGLKEVPGCVGNADKVVENWLKGTLLRNPNPMCQHKHEHKD